MSGFVCHLRAHAARGSNFLLLRQKKVTKEKATPTLALIQDLERKHRAVGNSLRSNSRPLHRCFRSKSWGRMDGGPSNRNLIASRLVHDNPDASSRFNFKTRAGVCDALAPEGVRYVRFDRR